MRGARRFAIAFWGAGLLLGAAAAPAQQATPTTSNTPATDAIGPPQLQNFSLQGNTTRPAEQPEQRAPADEASAARQPVTESPPTTHALTRRSETPAPPRAGPQTPAVREARSAPVASVVAPQVQQLTPAPPPPILPGSEAPPAPTSRVSFPPAAEAPSRRFSLLPWLLAGFALAVGGVFLLWRNRSRPALAGAPELDLFVAPEAEAALPPVPSAAPRPQAAPGPAPAPPAAAPIGIVSTALRPWIDMAILPKRCILTDQDVTIEFDLELFNSGGAPARDIAIEGMIVNAGPSQDEDLATFFGKPPVAGNRIEVIPPVHSMNIPTQLVVPRDFVVPVEMGGRQMFVPLLAFNAIYPVGSREGRTSTTFLVGRDGNGEKLAPFRLDLGPRTFRGLGARQLPTGIRN